MCALLCVLHVCAISRAIGARVASREEGEVLEEHEREVFVECPEED